MRTVMPFAAVAIASLIWQPVSGQQRAAGPVSPAQLELNVETAATSDDGYPSALRITIRNVGSVAVDMPVLKRGCSPDNWVQIESRWISDDPESAGVGEGGACGMSDSTAVMQRVQNEWVRLRPGEFMTDTERVHWNYKADTPGTVEYWVEYVPPKLTQTQQRNLLESGYIVSTRKLATEHASFRVH